MQRTTTRLAAGDRYYMKPLAALHALPVDSRPPERAIPSVESKMATSPGPTIAASRGDGAITCLRT